MNTVSVFLMGHCDDGHYKHKTIAFDISYSESGFGYFEHSIQIEFSFVFRLICLHFFGTVTSIQSIQHFTLILMQTQSSLFSFTFILCSVLRCRIIQ